MPYYKTLQKTTSNLLGNKLAKKYKIQKDFVIHKTKQQIQVITNDEVAYLIYDKYIIPTINYATKNNLVEKRVYLDDKATKPILGGADVMAPGIFKFIDKCDDFKEDDVVFIEIENEIVGVGIAMVDRKSITRETKGVAVEVWQRMGDWSKNFAL